MARKGVLTKGTQTWVLHGTASKKLTRIDCIKALDLGDENFEEIDSDCMDNTDIPTSEFSPGKPGDGSVTIDTDPTNATHLELLELAESREDFVIYVGWSDGTSAPTLASGGDDVTLPPDRTWTYATAKLRNSKPNFDPNSLVNHALPLRRQTGIVTEFKEQ